MACRGDPTAGRRARVPDPLRAPLLQARPVAAQGDILLYRRQGEGGTVVIALNLGPEPVSVASSSIGFGREILLSTFLDREGEAVQGALDLRGNEGVILGRSAQAG